MSVRARLVDALRKELLGPRKGIFEVIETDPRSEYMLGILEPASLSRTPLEYYRSVDLRVGQNEEMKEDDDISDTDADNLSLSLELDPRALPKSIGISFVLSSKGSILIDILATWARYEKIKNDGWAREPDHLLIKETDIRKDQEWNKNGLKVVLRTNYTQTMDFYVSIYLVNETYLEDKGRASTEDLIFQPQIRINCHEGGEIVPIRGEQLEDEEEAKLSLLYAKRPTLARGHLCSALWGDIDPERIFSGEIHDLPEDETPFLFMDGNMLSEEDREYFTTPSVRSEFIPCYAIEQVRFRPKKQYYEIPESKASDLSEAYDPELLGRYLDPIVRSYNLWIKEQDEESLSLPQQYKETAFKLIKDCKKTLQRIREGITLIKNDDDLRLSFCFMNKVMDMQSLWKNGQHLTWRLFQIAFILQNIAGISRKDHPDRKICDILWFPTGGGKTEAYQGLLILALALRRRRDRGKTHGGGGTGIISRYTLRMLTIQQFRRALVAIIAADYLRTINWRPKDYPCKDEMLWGRLRFSIGLWVGGDVTPNNLLDHKRFSRHRYRYEYFPGALGKLRGSEIYREKGYRVVTVSENEPAQVLNCPVCASILAIPKKRVLPSGTYRIHWIVSSASKPKITANMDSSSFKITKIEIKELQNPGYFALSIEFMALSRIGAQDTDLWWSQKIKPALGPKIKEAFARASRPGYFIRKWDVSKEDVDFEIHCPDPSCELNNARWIERVRGLDGKELNTQPLEPFTLPGFEEYSYSIPISAYVVDDQVYHRCPSLIIATVDKFARLPFEPKAGSLFGNVDRYDSVWGFYRNTIPPDRGELHPGDILSVANFEKPELIIQDELHLIEGPLGSLVGIYETAVEELASEKNGDTYIRPKYVASSATIQRVEPHVNAIFNRSISIFPPPGLSIDDNFFSHSREAHQLDSVYPGRLYLGVCAPGRGPHTPTIRIWTAILRKVYKLKKEKGDLDREVDQFWTVVGYFNALRELASASALYKQDMVERLRQIDSQPRLLEPSLELSSRMDSSEIPMALNQLAKFPRNVIDAVLATSMFGTGIDIDRLGLMIVHGQPKTTANYIQATGRVGRQMGGMVVTFYRSTRPRDLDHYEFFGGYHSCLHKYVEPITANPFSPRARERALGPVIVSILRNAETADGTKIDQGWAFEEIYTSSTTRIPKSGSRTIKKRGKAEEIRAIINILERRVQRQPLGRRPDIGSVRNEIVSDLDRWEAAANAFDDLLYSESTMIREPQHPVVLGDPQHELLKKVVFRNTPQSLREVESTTRFEG